MVWGLDTSSWENFIDSHPQLPHGLRLKNEVSAQDTVQGTMMMMRKIYLKGWIPVSGDRITHRPSLLLSSSREHAWRQSTTQILNW